MVREDLRGYTRGVEIFHKSRSHLTALGVRRVTRISTLRIHKFQAPSYKIYSPWRPGDDVIIRNEEQVEGLAQAVSSRLYTADARFRLLLGLDNVALRQFLLPVLQFFPCQCHSTNATLLFVHLAPTLCNFSNLQFQNAF